MIEFKRAEFKLEETSEEGEIAGYASVFDKVDQGFDIVEAGAFGDSIKDRVLPMLWSHDAKSPPIGKWTRAREDEKGLYVEGKLSLNIPRAVEVFEAIKDKSVNGLSIGFRTIKSRLIMNDNEDSIRVIEQAELWEVSVVLFPMNPESRIDAVKAAQMTSRDFERLLTRDAGFSRSVAQSLMNGGVSAVLAKRDAGDDLNQQTLKSILKELKAIGGENA